MKYKVVIQSSVYPCDVEFLKAQLRLTHNQHDSYLSSLIAAATDWANGFTGRNINSATLMAYCGYRYLIIPEYTNSKLLFIERGPNVLVTKIEYLNNSGSLIELVAVTDYEVFSDDYSAKIWLKESFFFDDINTTRDDAIRITFTSGWDGSDTGMFPEVVKNAVAMKAARMYTNPDDGVDEKVSVSENLLKSMRCPIV